jgi:sterol desaturase/sphingolipid hydroxylase (fatty acid hydroxylase superfamily)
MDTKAIFIISALVVIFLLEGVFPHYRGRAARVRHGLPHVITAILNSLLTKFALVMVTIMAIDWAENNSVGLARALPFPATTNLIFVFALFDIWMYFWHMANHRIGFFWRFHRAHHSDTEMDTTTALRFHPGELVLSTFFRLPVVVLIGMSFSQLVLFEVMLNVSTLFHHSNLAVPEKWDRLLRRVIVTPNMHRVHHSTVLAETNSNFTSLLSVWDRVFRSFRTRPDTHTITLGLPAFREPNYQRLWGFLITPLK